MEKISVSYDAIIQTSSASGKADKEDWTFFAALRHVHKLPYMRPCTYMSNPITNTDDNDILPTLPPFRLITHTLPSKPLTT